ncbi:MAG: tetratricopeptide repeat protein [candidate division WOR-3 bacterium]|nr:tetratricopeptide repeat protein [candidate division WOR-3 bacterium]
MPVDSFAHVAASLKGALGQARPLLTWNWLAVTVAGLVIAAIFGAIVGSVKWLFPRLGRWKRYRWDQEPLTMFPADYRYKPDVFVTRGDRAEKLLRKAFAETSGSILIRGPSGVGKSSVLVWLLRENGLSAYMPTDDDLAHHDTLRTNKSVIILDNLHDLKRRNRDGDVTYWLQKNRPRVIGLVPDEAYEETRPLLGQFACEARVELWSESEGRTLAGAYGTVFSKDDFRHTALSVVAPESQMRRLYERECDSDGRAVLNALKVVKSLTGSFVPRRVIALYAERFRNAEPDKADNVLRGVEPRWCQGRDEYVLLRDGFEPAIGATFSWDSDAWKNLLSVLLDKSVPEWHYVAASMAWQLMDNGRQEAALTVAERCIAAGCTDPLMLVVEGAALDKLGRKEDAKSAMSDALTRFETAKNKAGAALAAHDLAVIHQSMGDLAEAHKLYSRALAIERELGNKSGTAKTLHQFAVLTQSRGDYPEARKLYDQSLAIERELGDKSGIAITLHQLAMLVHDQGHYPEARKLYEQALNTFKELGAKSGQAAVHHQLANVAYVQGDLAQARKLYSEALETFKELGDKSGIASTLHQLASLAFLQGDHAEARKLYDRSLAIAKELSDKSVIAKTLIALGNVALAETRLPDARSNISDGLALARQLGAREDIAMGHGALARIAETEKDDPTALKNYLRAFSIFEELRSPHSDLAKRDIARMRERLGEAAFKKLHEEATAELNEEQTDSEPPSADR